MSLIRQKDAPSLLINGDFNSGLAGWEVMRGVAVHGVNYITAGNDDLSRKNSGSPLYVAKLVRPDSAGQEQYTEIGQTITRKDIWSFPSEHYVTKAYATPISPTTVRIEFAGDTTLNGREIQSEASIAFHTNSYGEQIPIAEGSELLVEVPKYENLTGVFRAGSTVKYTIGSGSSQVDKYYITASPTNKIPSITSHEETSAGFYTEGTTTFIRINHANTFNRKIQSNGATPTTGIQPGDTLVIEDIEERPGVLFAQTASLRRRPDYSVCKVTSVSTTDTSTILGVASVPGAPFIPANLPNVKLNSWYIFPKFQINFVKYIFAYRYEFTLAFSVYPNTILSNNFDSFLVEPYIDVVDPTTGESVGIPINNTLVPLTSSPNPNAFAFGESAPTSNEPGLATTFRRHMFRFLGEFKAPLKGNLRVRIRYQPLDSSTTTYPETFEIGDVVLYKGDFLTRHDFSYLDDSSDTSTALPADKRSALDRLLHKVDEYAGVVPKGTVILYSGPRCPPGFKRVDSIASSPTDGIWSSIREASSGETETFPALPPPEGASYDAVRNRTILTWSNVPATLLDANDRPIMLKGVGKQVLLSTPGTSPTFGEMELFTIETPQTKVQPGMSLRIRSSRDRGIYDLHNRRYDYSTMVRQISVTRQHVEGVYLSDNPLYDGISYPMFIPFDSLPPAIANTPPAGPIYTLSTTQGNASNNQNLNSLTIKGEDQTTFNQELYQTTSNGGTSNSQTYFTTVPQNTSGGPPGTYSFIGPVGTIPLNGVFGNPVGIPGGLADSMELLTLNKLEFGTTPSPGDVFALTLLYRIERSTLISRGYSNYGSIPVTSSFSKLVAQLVAPSGNTPAPVDFVYFVQRVIVKVDSAVASTSTITPNGSVTVRSYNGAPLSSYVGAIPGFSQSAGIFYSGTTSENQYFSPLLRTSAVGPPSANNPPSFWNDMSSPYGNVYAFLSDAKLFDPTSVVVNKTVIRGKAMWSVRSFKTTLTLSVFGDVSSDVRANNFEGVVLEPSGYIRYGDTVVDDLYPDGRIRGFSYGSMGHSHEISQGNATFNENIAPRVATYKESEVAPTAVARKHGHGFFPKYIYPMPQFAAYLMCEKI
jgi:hypothetical protein